MYLEFRVKRLNIMAKLVLILKEMRSNINIYVFSCRYLVQIHSPFYNTKYIYIYINSLEPFPLKELIFFIYIMTKYLYWYRDHTNSLI